MSLEEVELAAVAGLEDVEGGVVSATVGELAVQHQVLDAEARLPSRLLDGVLSLVEQRVMFRVSAWASPGLPLGALGPLLAAKANISRNLVKP